MRDLESWLDFCRAQDDRLKDDAVVGVDAQCICANLLNYDDFHSQPKETKHA